VLFALPSAAGRRRASCLPPLSPAASSNVLCRASAGPTRGRGWKRAGEAGRSYSFVAPPGRNGSKEHIWRGSGSREQGTAWSRSRSQS
jgi:hypothetical protein